jgi:hypothetical protein
MADIIDEKIIYHPYEKVSTAFHIYNTTSSEEEWIKHISDRGVSGTILNNIPENMRTYKICCKCVEKTGSALEFVPEQFRGFKELCMLAVSSYGNAIYYVPIGMRDKEMCLHAVKYSGYLIAGVPVETRDYEICLTAVQYSGESIKYVPIIHRTRELCLIAYNTGGSYCIEYIPNSIKTEAFFIKAIKTTENIYLAVHVLPKEYFTKTLVEEILKRGINKFNLVFDFIPKELITQEMKNALIDFNLQLIKQEGFDFSRISRSIVPMVFEKIGNKLPERKGKEFDFNELSECLFTGEQFNKLIGERKLCKLTNKEENHNGFLYQTGHNALDEKKELFNPSGSCCKGGLYFTEQSKKNLWTHGNSYFRSVTIPDKALVYVESNKFKTNQFILGAREDLGTLDMNNP